MDNNSSISNTVKVYIATTWIKVACNKLAVTASGVSLAEFIRKTLHEHEWNPKIKCLTLVAKYVRYDTQDGFVYMPRYALDKLVDYLAIYNVSVVKEYVDPIKPRTIKASMKKDVQLREIQVPIVDFLTDEDINGFKPLALQTGSGKTICAIYSAVKLGYPTLIILQGLIEQWISSILQFTTIRRDDIYVVKGFDTLKVLWNMIKNGFKPKILIFSTRTLALYAFGNRDTYENMPPFHQLCDDLSIGTKIIDECHLNFNTNCLIDLNCNIKMNIYLSATYARNSRDGRKIFDMYFPSELKYGEQFVKKYSTVYVVYYQLCIPREHMVKFKSQHGYNHSAYEKYIYKRPKFVKEYVKKVIYPILNFYYLEKRRDNQHCLILTQTRNMAEELFHRLVKVMNSNISMSVYFSGDAGPFGDEKNLTKDIIISTISSCGTGRDIKGLKTCINTVSTSSPPLTLQCFGRLREIPGEDTYYIDLCNEEIFSQRQHVKVRLSLYKPKAKDIIEFKIK